MRVEFAATLDDLVDVHLRSLARSPAARRQRWSETLWTGLSAGIVIYLLAPEPLETKLTLGVLGLIAIAAYYSLVYQRTIKQRLRNHCLEYLGGDLAFTVEVQLFPQFVSFRQLNVETRYEWADVEEIQVNEDSVDIVVRRVGLNAVRKRAFDSNRTLEKFVALAQTYVDQARRESDIPPSS